MICFLCSKTISPARRRSWTIPSAHCRSSGTGLQTEVTQTVNLHSFTLCSSFLGLYRPLLLSHCHYSCDSISSSSSHGVTFQCSILKMLSCRVSGALVFQLKKRPPDYQGRKGRKVDDKGLRGKDGSSSSLPPEKLPYLVELSPGTDTTTTRTTLHRISVIKSLSRPDVSSTFSLLTPADIRKDQR